MAKDDARISFHVKFIPDNEIQIFLNAANVVVLPFARILTSGTANLAMSFRRPIIVPKTGCLPELVAKDSGWLFEPDNSKFLAEAMKLSMAGDANEIGNKAYEKMLHRSSKRFASQTLHAYVDSLKL